MHPGRAWPEEPLRELGLDSSADEGIVFRHVCCDVFFFNQLIMDLICKVGHFYIGAKPRVLAAHLRAVGSGESDMVGVGVGAVAGLDDAEEVRLCFVVGALILA